MARLPGELLDMVRGEFSLSTMSLEEAKEVRSKLEAERMAHWDLDTGQWHSVEYNCSGHAYCCHISSLVRRLLPRHASMCLWRRSKSRSKHSVQSHTLRRFYNASRVWSLCLSRWCCSLVCLKCALTSVRYYELDFGCRYGLLVFARWTTNPASFSYAAPSIHRAIPWSTT